MEDQSSEEHEEWRVEEPVKVTRKPCLCDDGSMSTVCSHWH